MHFYHLLLVILLALVACCGTLADPEAVKSSTATITRRSAGRLLRVEDTLDKDQNAAEDRAGLWSNLKLKWWLKNGKSDDYVKKALGMKGVAEAALKTHPNYGLFEKFQLTKWYEKEKLTTYDAWMRLKLNDLPADLLSKAEGFKTYVNYVNIFDKHAIKALKDGRKTPPLLSSSASEQEMMQRATIWGINRRPEEYVRTVLGMKEGLEFGMMLNSPYYKQYMSMILDSWRHRPPSV